MAKLEISANLGENLYDPRSFVDAAAYAEEMGFHTVWFGDHIYPWFHSGKRAAFCWSVMSVALDRTNSIKVGPWVTVPTGARYHPAIIAQASATLDNMYPGRVLLGVGTGEALNETPFWNGKWPDWEERMERLTEGVRLIRKMWESTKPFKFEGKYFGAEFYFLYTKPRRKIPLYMSAIGRKAAEYAGEFGDGLITITPRNDVEKLTNTILPSYRKGRRKAGKSGPGRVAAEVIFSFDRPEDVVRKQWRTLGLFKKDSWSISNPVAVEETGRKVTVDDVKKQMHFCRNWKDVVNLLESYGAAGLDEVSINTSCDKKMIRAVARNLLSVF